MDSSSQASANAQASEFDFQPVLDALGLGSEERCRKIQKGNLWLKRLARWSVLFSIGPVLFIGDMVSAVLARLDEAESVTTTFAFRWTAGWFVEVPEQSAALVNILRWWDCIQFAFFGVTLVIAGIWMLADYRVEKRLQNVYMALFAFAVIANFVSYALLHAVVNVLI